MSERTISRRMLLQGGTVLVAAAALPGCSFLNTDPAEKSDGGTAVAGQKEAPSLAELVEQGELPPLDERLPTNPMVVTPVSSPGVYGGTWRSAMVTEEDVQWMWYALAYEPLVRWASDWTGKPGYDEILPNVAEYTVNDDSTEFTFTLREGMKWSDGEPCTADDILFAVHDMACDPDLHPDGIYDVYLSPDTGEIADIQKVDERTVRFTYTAPQPSLLAQIAYSTFRREGPYGMLLPKHYLEQFHKKYNPDADSLAKDAGLDSWIDLIAQKQNQWTNPDQPTLAPWMVTTALGDGDAVIVDRNPYYWKVDEDGRQLPYIDRCRVEVLQDVEVELLKVMNGEYHMQYRNFGTPQNKPLVAENRESGGYELFDVATDLTNAMIIGFNQTHPDPATRELYQNLDFRVGLSHAIDRQEIIDAVYAGQGVPWQCAPSEDSPYYNEQLATQYLEFDEAKANEHLDAAGLTERNGDGIRLRADGKPVAFNVLVATDFPDHVEAMEMVKKRWRAVGVDMRTDPVAESLYKERVYANQHDAGVWTGGSFDVPTGTGGNHYFVPSNSGSARQGPQWAKWYESKGAEGEVPPPAVKKQIETFTAMRHEGDPDKALALAEQVLQMAADQFYYIGTCTAADTYGIVRDDFHNVPQAMVDVVPPGLTFPEQYYISE